jgi:hypothetical protein
MPSDLGLRSTIGLGLVEPCTAVAPSVAPNSAGMIPNPRGSVVVHPVIAVEDGGSPLSDRLGATAEALDLPGGGGGPGVAHEASDVLQGLVAVHERCRDDGAATGVGAELGSDTGGLAGLLDDLGNRLPQHDPVEGHPVRVGGRSGLTERAGFPTSAPIFTASSTTRASVWRWFRTVRGVSSRASLDDYSGANARRTASTSWLSCLVSSGAPLNRSR